MTRDLVPPLLLMYCMTLGKSAHSLDLNFPIWEINFGNLQPSFGINDFTPTLLEVRGGGGRVEKQYTQHAVQRGDGGDGLTISGERPGWKQVSCAVPGASTEGEGSGFRF